MRLIKPSIEYVDMSGNPLNLIERAGRTCYKSEDKITDESAPWFVKGILQRGHEAMIEHCNFIMHLSGVADRDIRSLDWRPFIHLTPQTVSGNARAFRDMYRRYPSNWVLQEIIAYLRMQYPVLFEMQGVPPLSALTFQNIKPVDRPLSPEELLEHMVLCYRIICDRGVTHEIVRHRPPSYAQESTRYCNYKGGVQFIIPSWVDIEPGEYFISWCGVSGETTSFVPKSRGDGWWFWHCAIAERDYRKLIDNGWNPQQARSVLPNSLKTEIVMTCNLAEWKHFFSLRTAETAHPQMQEIAIPILEDMKTRVPKEVNIEP
jgi:thymidylate synthase (FAD)